MSKPFRNAPRAHAHAHADAKKPADEQATTSHRPAPAAAHRFGASRRAAGAAWLLCSAALLSACGGGSSSDADDDSADASTTISTDAAQAQAADASTVPTGSADALEAASSELTLAVESSASTADADVTVQSTSASTGSAPRTAFAGVSAQAAAYATSSDISAACSGGGSVSFSVTGATLAQLLNGTLDTGEVYTVTYDDCVQASTGTTLDGSLSLTVNAVQTETDSSTGARTDTTDLSLSSNAGLALVTDDGRATLTGSVAQRRVLVTQTDSSQLLQSRLQADSGLSWAASLNGRAATHALQGLDWTVQRSVDANGALQQRSHQGSLTLVSNSPARGNATLAVVSNGALVLGSDGLLASGSLSLTSSGYTLGIAYAPETVTLSVDEGSDGSLERSWTLTPRALALLTS